MLSVVVCKSMEHYAVSTKKHKWSHALVAQLSRRDMIGRLYIINDESRLRQGTSN